MIKKIILILSLVSALFADANSPKDSILEIFDNINKINAQMRILTQDTNSTDPASTNTLIARKNQLLSDLPLLIMDFSYTKEDEQDYKTKEQKLERVVNLNSRNKSSQIYIKNMVALTKIRLESMFFKNISDLGELFKRGSKSAGIKSLIDNTLIEIRADIYANIKDIKDNSNGVLVDDVSALEDDRQTAEEIFTYIRNNADFLSSSFALNEFNLNSTLEYINSLMPFKFKWLNVGKVVLITFVFLLFVSLTKILAKLTYFLTLSFFAKNKHIDDIKEQILNIIKKPISSLLIAYALKICISIGYYPTPVPYGVVNAMSIVYIVLFGWFAITVLNGYGMLLISELAKKSGRKEVVNLILKIVYFIIIVITLLLILSKLGFDISAIIASLGIGGLAVAFAAKDIIANFFASVMLLFDNSFSQGDLIVCDGIEGTIVEIGLRKTTIRSADNALIFVPNSTLASEAIINWSRRKIGRLINITLGLTYSSKPEALKNCIAQIEQMLQTHPDIAKEEHSNKSSVRLRLKDNIVSVNDLIGYKNAIYVSLNELNSSSIDIAVTCYSKDITRAEYSKVKEDIIFKMMDIVADNGLEFAFPSQTLYFDKNELKG